MSGGYFNSYKDGLDLAFLRQYCMTYGKVQTFQCGDRLETAGKPSRWIAYIEEGYFKYLISCQWGDKTHCAGFAFAGDFVANYPFCLDGAPSELTIEAGMPCKVILIEGKDLQRMYDEDIEKMHIGLQLMKGMFKMVYTRYLDNYRYTPRERYLKLLDRCPQIVRIVPLKDIASFLNITPTYLSTIRKEITFNDEK